MNTFLDLLIVVSMVLITVGLLSVALMFLVKNKKVRQVCFYIAVALGLYIGYVGIRINWFGFSGQAAFAALLALIGVGAFVLERVKKDSDKAFLFARIAAAAALPLGIMNALFL